ncbi:MAG TPA: DNA repair protein RadC [Candidatus Saccharimonadales bacterium]|nr:DNA repair protein RadC [Candidatus Saccharimonadales bacterium]
MPKQRRLTDIPALDRPREKLYRKGVAALSDFELLEVMIGSGTANADVSSIARQVQKILRRGSANLSTDALLQIKGIHISQASKLLAGFELAQRHLVRDVQPLRTLHDITARLDSIRQKQQEHFVALSLDGGQRLLAQRAITIGTLDTVLAHPREVFADPIVDRAAYIVVAHNHPSGLAQPSAKDRELTNQLAAAGQLLGIPLHDHIILTKTEIFSFRQHHLL